MIPSDPVMARILYKLILPELVQRLEEDWVTGTGPHTSPVIAFKRLPKPLFIFDATTYLCCQVGGGNQYRTILYERVSGMTAYKRYNVERIAHRYLVQRE